jgi:hypothetical protein
VLCELAGWKPQSTVVRTELPRAPTFIDSPSRLSEQRTHLRKDANPNPAAVAGGFRRCFIRNARSQENAARTKLIAPWRDAGAGVMSVMKN